ncbi:family 16 putative glycoside hydrolase [Podospora australis]|uniref:chitinase n=1 Tax=Podospora australis TaxID=1536484 RepID=A0AAN6WQR5_9PEZI|nr:family 16 putative glycoside hydrolase [Podospora australis]
MWLPRSLQSPALALLAGSFLFSNIAAQVTTDCFPMNQTCPPNPALGIEHNFVFNSTPRWEMWENTASPPKYDPVDGATFSITKQGESSTVRSKFYIFWGRVELWLKTSHGTGIISSFMMLSDNLDEIDWEFFGGNNTIAQSNYFGKNTPDFTNAGYHDIGANTQADYHNYTIVWTKDAMDFYVDNKKYRTLTPGQAEKDGKDLYPQTPMRLYLSLWAGGDPSLPEGTREWAGGTTDYGQGPFHMYVKNMMVTDFSSGKEYEYGDKSGSWQSIKIVEGNSTVNEIINAPPEKTMNDKWNELPNTAKIAIYASGAAVGAALLAAALIYCIKQRRRGVREAAAAEARAEAERLEMERFRKNGVNPDAFTSNAHEYNASEMRTDGLSDKAGYNIPPSPSNEKYGTGDMAVAAAAGAGAGAAAAVPLLRNNGPGSPRSPTSPRVPTPDPQTNPFSPQYGRIQNTGSPAPSPQFNPHEGMRSPSGSMYGQSMSPPPHQPLPHPPTRSMTGGSGQMRMASPGPQQAPHGFDFGPGIQRSATTSPGPNAPLAHPQPQRSFTNPASGYGQPPQLQQPPPGGNQGYWDGGNNGGYR